MKNYVLFDLETSGLNSRFAEIIELSALKIIDGKVVSEFSTLVKPNKPLDPASTKVNGITDNMLKDAPRLSEVLTSFLSFIEDDVLLGYNISTFDMPILRRVVSECFNMELTNDYIDILYSARESLSFLPNRKLSTVAAYFGIDITGAHRALTDCYITKDCYEKLSELSSCICSTQNKRQHKSTLKYKRTLSKETEALQTLQGLLLGVIADNTLTETEILTLKKWLDDNMELAGQYPFDRVFIAIEKALKDGILEQYELDEMLSLFKKFTAPIEEIACSEILTDLANKTVCLTGDFSHGSRKDIESIVKQLGGICRSSVSSKTDYVIVGSLGSPDWSCGNYGTKIKKALELQEKGKPIQILKETNLFDILENQENQLMATAENDETNPIYKKIQEIIDNIIISHDLPINSVHLHSNESPKTGKEVTKSICIFEPEYPPKKSYNEVPGKNFVVMNIKSLKNGNFELLIRNKQYDSISTPNSAIVKSLRSDTTFMHIIFQQNDETILEYIKENIVYCLANYKSNNSFGCCSRFNECSDAKKCVHENKIYSMGCKYRSNLELGRIFYSKNKNI